MAQAQEVFLFQPTSITGCQLWLDAADQSSMSLTGSVVNTWNDKSGSGITYISSNSPTLISNALNGNSVMNFVGSSSQYFYGGVASSCDLIHTHFFVYFNSVQSIGQTLFGSSNQGNIVQEGGGACYGDAAGFTDGAVYKFQTGGAYRLLSVLVSSPNTYPTTNGTVYFNGTQIALVNNSGGYNFASKPTNLLIGSGNTKYTGTMAEGIVYAGLLTTSQRQQIEGYLAWKWGLQGNLPSNHPFKNYRPLANTPIPTQVPNMPIVTQTTQAFAPTQISGCQLWLDATDPIGNGIPPSNGAGLSIWKDKSTNGLSGTAVSSPTYQTNVQNGLPVIRFNGTNQYINFGNVLNLGTNGLTVFMVTKYAINPGNQVGMVGKASYRGNFGRWAMVYDTVAGGPNGVGVDFFMEDGFSSLAGMVFNPATQFNIFTGFNNRTSVNQIYANGTLGNQQPFTGTASNMTNTDPLYVASYPNGTGTGPQTGMFMNGDIGEVLVYFSALSTLERQQVEGYLAWKWGLTANLPVGHPYKRNPIAPFSYRATSFVGGLNIWQPTQISGCQLWLDGADPNGTGILPANSASISTWADKSGNSRNATQATANLQPSFNSSLKSITFNGSRYLNMTNAFTMLGSGGVMTTFVVEKRGSSNNTQFWLAGGGSSGNNGVFFGYNTSTVVRYTFVNVNDLDYTVGAWANPDPVRLWSAGFSSSLRDMYLNATEVASQSYTAGGIASWNTPVIGYIPLASINTYYTGEIYEMLFYNSYLSRAQRQTVEGYLAWKWGLQGSLPANHPYKRWPPSP